MRVNALSGREVTQKGMFEDRTGCLERMLESGPEGP